MRWKRASDWRPLNDEHGPGRARASPTKRQCVSSCGSRGCPANSTHRRRDAALDSIRCGGPDEPYGRFTPHISVAT
jgi:hypothetical protein